MLGACGSLHDLSQQPVEAGIKVVKKVAVRATSHGGGSNREKANMCRQILLHPMRVRVLECIIAEEERLGVKFDDKAALNFVRSLFLVKETAAP